MKSWDLVTKIAIALAVTLTTGGIATADPADFAEAAHQARRNNQPRRAPARRADPFADRWMYSAGGRDRDGQEYPATAFYGPPASDNGTSLLCGPRGIEISFIIGESRPGLANATIVSGNRRLVAPTSIDETELGDSLSFTIPFGAPVLANLPARGFTISFSNGERNPFPGGSVLTRFLNACRPPARPVASSEWAGNYRGERSSLSISPAGPDGSHEVQAVGYYLREDGSTGSITVFYVGRATARGNILTARLRGDGSAVDGQSCTISARQNGARLRLDHDCALEIETDMRRVEDPAN